MEGGFDNCHKQMVLSLPTKNDGSLRNQEINLSSTPHHLNKINCLLMTSILHCCTCLFVNFSNVFWKRRKEGHFYKEQKIEMMYLFTLSHSKHTKWWGVMSIKTQSFMFYVLTSHIFIYQVLTTNLSCHKQGVTFIIYHRHSFRIVYFWIISCT